MLNIFSYKVSATVLPQLVTTIVEEFLWHCMNWKVFDYIDMNVHLYFSLQQIKLSYCQFGNNIDYFSAA
jgi:hypothetical protein